MSRDKVKKRRKHQYMEIAPEIYGIRKLHVTTTKKKRIQVTN